MSADAVRTDLVDAAVSFLSDFGRVREYSGRSMYGRYCLGLEINDEASEWRVAVAIGELDDEDEGELKKLLRRCPCSDDMGRGTILYWMGIPYGEEAPDA